jgi:hypothetical protein
MPRGRIYHAVHFLAVALAAGTFVAVMSGLAPLVQYRDLPFGGAVPFLALVVLIPGGFLAARALVARDWRRAARSAGLTAEGEGRYPTFSTTVDGRRVRAAVRHERRVGDDGGSTFAVVEADLARPADAGTVVSHTRGDGPDFEPFPITDPDATASDRDLVAAGDSTLAGAVITGPAGDALAAVDDLSQVYAGAAAAVVTGLEPGDGLRWENEKEAAFRRGFGRLDWTSDAATVAHVAPAVPTSTHTIAQRVEAVAAVADAVEWVST